MNTPHLSEQEICLYVDALKLDRTEQLPQHIVDHVAACMECKREIMQLYDILREEKYNRAGEHPSLRSLKKPNRVALVYRIAAAFVLCLGAVLAAYFGYMTTSHNSAPSAQSALVDTTRAGNLKDTQTTSPAQKSFAANFAPSPNMENLVGGELRAASVTVQSPVNGQAVTGKIVFRWRSAGKATFKVRILTNREEEVFRATTDRNMALCDRRLDPGLYYWTLMEDGELVHVGEFTINVP